MNRNIRRLNLLFKFTCLKPEWFYCISINDGGITLQGYFKPEIVLEIKRLFKDDPLITKNGHIEFKVYNIEVILT